MQGVEEEEEGRGSLSFRMESPERISAAVDSSVGGGGVDGYCSDDGNDFDFSFVRFPDSGLPPIAAEDIFSDGKIRPIYPVFNRELLSAKESAKSELKPPLRMPLRRLFIEEEKEQASFSSTSSSSTASSLSSSSSMDALEGIPEGTYCVWTPTANKDRCKKSNSTGSTGSSSSLRRWRLRDLVIGRSQSYGKERFVFIPIQQEKKEKEKEKQEINDDDDNKSGNKSLLGKEIMGKSTPSTEADLVAARRRRMTMMRKQGSGQEHFPIGKSTGSTGRRSYLPYKPDLVGFFANVNANGLRGQTPF